MVIETVSAILDRRQVRPHEHGRIGFKESMALACYLSLDPREWPYDVLAWVRCHRPGLAIELRHLTQRYFGPDDRNGWNSWLVSAHSKPVLWTDGKIEGVRILHPIEMYSA